MKSLLISHYNKLEIRFNVVRVRRNNLTIVRKTSALKKYTVLLTVKCLSFQHYNDVTWTLLCLKCPTTPWFVQYSIQAHNKETPKPALRALCEGNPSVTDGFPHKGLIMWKAFHAVILYIDKQRVLMHGHQGWNVRHGLCHMYMIYVYIWVVYSFCLFCCLFIIVTTQFVALYKPCKPKPKPSNYDPPDNHPLAEIQRPILWLEPKQQICHQHANTDHFGK